jgi:thiamine biosynthesis lipoprotein
VISRPILAERFGHARDSFECCDTVFTVEVRGPGAGRACDRARTRARSLEATLDAFDGASAVTRLNEAGRVENKHVARVVRRALDINGRTGGVFDVRRGQFEHALKAFLCGERETRPDFEDIEATVSVAGDTVETTAPLDLNGLAKGYIVDNVYETASGVARLAFVSGGGDMTPPPGVVGIESPWGDDHLAYLDTDWAVATSGGYRCERAGTDHIYDPRNGKIGSRHDSVTVLARRDCTTADALATTLSVLSHGDALALAESWDGVEAMVVTDGVFRRTEGFEEHDASA